MKKPLSQTFIPSLFFIILFCFLSIVPFFLSPQSGRSIWRGYRVLSVDYSVADTVDGLLKDITADGLVSWNQQVYPRETFEGLKFCSAKDCKGKYYRMLRNWFFDDSTSSQFFYLPFPENYSEQCKYSRYVESLLAPIDGFYVLEKPSTSGSYLYAIIFFLFAVLAVMFLQRPVILLFIVPLLCQVIVFKQMIMLISVILEFSAVFIFYLHAWNDGFSPFNRKICITTVKSPFFYMPTISGMLLSCFSGILPGFSFFMSLLAMLSVAAAFLFFYHYKNIKRLHPRLKLTALTSLVGNNLQIYVKFCVSMAMSLLCGGICFLGNWAMPPVSGIPAKVPAPYLLDSATDCFSFETFLDVLEKDTSSNSTCYVPSFADYVACRWFEKMSLYVSVERIREFEDDNSQFTPVTLTFTHYAVEDNELVPNVENFLPEKTFVDILNEPLPPLEYMMARLGSFFPVSYAEIKQLNVNDQNKVLTLLPCGMLIVICVIAFFKLYFSGARQKGLFHVLLQIRSNK